MDLGDLGLLQNWENYHENNRDVIETSLHCTLRQTFNIDVYGNTASKDQVKLSELNSDFSN